MMEIKSDGTDGVVDRLALLPTGRTFHMRNRPTSQKKKGIKIFIMKSSLLQRYISLVTHG
jgi:hypothetical protein